MMRATGEGRPGKDEEREHYARALEMRQLLLGHLTSSALSAAATLRIPDLLDEEPTTVAELSARTGTQPKPLHRLLRALAAFDVVEERPDGTFVLLPLGETLRGDVPGSALPSALLAGAEIGAAWGGLLQAVRTGKPAFDEVFGTDFFSYLEDRPDLRSVFYSSQAADLEVMLEQLEVVDFARYPTIVDIGGGDGALLEHILRAAPNSYGVLLDTPTVAAKALERITRSGLDDRCEVVSGDFFETVPAIGDLYLLREVLHDWPDDRCVRLLGVCRAAIPAHATLMIIERVADERAPRGADARLLSLMDLYMLSVLDGRERSMAEFGSLLAEGGFEVRSYRRLSSGVAVIEAKPRAS